MSMCVFLCFSLIHFINPHTYSLNPRLLNDSCPRVVCDSCREEYCCGPVCEKCNSDREHLMQCDKCEAPVCEKCIVITKGLREGNICKTCKAGGVSVAANPAEAAVST